MIPLNPLIQPPREAQLPRFTPALRIPRDPDARDHRWADRWPLRTELELGATLRAPGCARDHVRAVLGEWRSSSLADPVALIVSELMTNSVRSVREHRLTDPVRLWMLGDKESVLLLVWDATVPVPVRAAVTTEADERGRGLVIVEALCPSWGYYRPTEDPGGKVTWALLDPRVTENEQ